MWQGYFTALVTPFHTDGSVDMRSFAALVTRQVEAGIAGLLLCGTTGEAFLLSPAEQKQLFTEARRLMPESMRLIAGVTALTPQEAIVMAHQAQEAGAQALSIAPPPYLRPSQEGLYAHYKAIHEVTTLPLMIYDNPGRSAVSLSVDTVVRLAQLPRVAVLKESNGQVERVPLLRAQLPQRVRMLAGDDGPAPAYMAMGGDGCVSVISNIAPRACVRLHAAWQKGDLTTFARERDALALLNAAVFKESNPMGVKYALSALGLCHNVLRAPLTGVSADTAAAIDAVLGLPQEVRYG